MGMRYRRSRSVNDAKLSDRVRRIRAGSEGKSAVFQNAGMDVVLVIGTEC